MIASETPGQEENLRKKGNGLTVVINADGSRESGKKFDIDNDACDGGSDRSILY